MKRLIYIAIILFAAIALAACSDPEEPKNVTPGTNNTTNNSNNTNNTNNTNNDLDATHSDADDDTSESDAPEADAVDPGDTAQDDADQDDADRSGDADDDASGDDASGDDASGDDASDADEGCPDPEDDEVHYVNEDPEACTTILFSCAPSQTTFNDACGCGCLGPAPAEPTSCGGIVGEDVCTADEYCHYERVAGISTCHANGIGECTPRPTEDCTADLIQVCGCDGNAYPGQCDAAKAGTDVASSGPCTF